MSLGTAFAAAYAVVMKLQDIQKKKGKTVKWQQLQRIAAGLACSEVVNQILKHREKNKNLSANSTEATTTATAAARHALRLLKTTKKDGNKKKLSPEEKREQEQQKELNRIQ